MKYICLLSFITLLSIASLAQAKDENELSAAVEKLRKAMVDGDRASLAAIVSDKLSYGHSGGRVENKTEFIEKIASGQSTFVSIELSEQTITMAGHVAVVRHILLAATNDNNTPGTIRLKILLVWHKEKGGWKLLARQAVKLS